MTDKLTPAHLRDLADAIDAPNAFAPGAEIASKLRQEAARREAEAKPVKVSQPVCHEPGGCIAPVACVQFGKCPQKPEAAPQGEREGPGSAAAPEQGWPSYDFLLDYWKKHHVHVVEGEDKPTPAADELLSVLKDIISDYGTGRLSRTAKAAIDRIEAQAREIAELKRDQIETERSLVFWEKRADVAEAKAARLVIQMERAKIMIGARLDAMGPALREAEVNAAWHVLNAALAEAGHAK